MDDRGFQERFRDGALASLRAAALNVRQRGSAPTRAEIVLRTCNRGSPPPRLSPYALFMDAMDRVLASMSPDDTTGARGLGVGSSSRPLSVNRKSYFERSKKPLS